MPHISKRKISEKVTKEMQRLFVDFTTSKYKGEILIFDLLTKTEKIMLAKRLAIVYLLKKKISTHRIFISLKVSPSTADRFKKEIRNGRFRAVENFISSKNKNTDKVKDILESLLFAGIPRYSGKERWKWLDEILKK